jgi:hypothetical protein
MSNRHHYEFLELPVRPARGPQTPPVHGHCTYCGGEVLIVDGSVKPHNFGMRLCPGSWQRPAAAEGEDRADYEFIVR